MVNSMWNWNSNWEQMKERNWNEALKLEVWRFTEANSWVQAWGEALNTQDLRRIQEAADQEKVQQLLQEIENWEWWDFVFIERKNQLENNFLLDIDAWISWIKAELIQVILFFKGIQNFLEEDVFSWCLDSQRFSELLSKLYQLHWSYESHVKNKLWKLNEEFNSRKYELINEWIYLFENRSELFNSIELHRLFEKMEELFRILDYLIRFLVNNYWEAIDKWYNHEKISTEFSYLEEDFKKIYEYLEKFDLQNNVFPEG